MVDISGLLPDAVTIDDLFGTFNAVLVWLAVPLLVMLGVAILPSVAAALSSIIAILGGGSIAKRAQGGNDRTVVMEKRSPLEQGYFEASNDMADLIEEEQYAEGYEYGVKDKMGVI